MVEALLKAGANPNRPALPNQVTPLMAAARAGSARAVNALVRARADVRARETIRDQTALMWAASQRHPEVVKALVAAGAAINDRSKRTVVSAATGEERGAPQPHQLADFEEGGYTPLLFAARSGDAESARALIEAGASVNDAAPSGASVLVIAAHSGHTELARLLLDRGADPGSDGAGYTPLLAAVLRGDEALVTTLLARGARPNAPLRAPTIRRRFHKEWSFDVAWVGASPLFLAARFADAGIMRALVTAGADPTFTMKDGTTILMAAAGMGTRGIADTSGTDRRSRALDPAEVEIAQAHDGDSRTIMPSGIDAVRYAIELGVPVNAASAAGDTALHAAAGHGFTSVIDVLLKHGARLDTKNKAGLTPLAVAKQQKRPASVLQKLGAL
jgi:ankyrin repeat protein